MDWKGLGKKVAALGAPVVGAALGPAGAVVGGLVARKLGLPDNATPDTIQGVIDANPEDAKRNLIALDGEQAVELERLKLAAETTAIEADTERQRIVNTTMRAEIKADNWYVQCWRPTFGYVVSAVVGWIGAGIGYAIIYAVLHPEPARLNMLTAIAGLLSDLSFHFGFVAAILGVAVAKRSADKALSAGNEKPQGFIAGVLSGMKK